MRLEHLTVSVLYLLYRITGNFGIFRIEEHHTKIKIALHNNVNNYVLPGIHALLGTTSLC